MWLPLAKWLAGIVTGPVFDDLLKGYQARLAAGNTAESIAADLAAKELAVQQRELELQTQLRDFSHGWTHPGSFLDDLGSSLDALCEQQRIHHSDIDAVVDRAIATVLASFGIEEEDRRELRADFQHLRRWRKSVEQAQGFSFKAVITVIVAGFLGAVWLGIKAMLGK
jgi:hypothetical protein